MNQREKEAYLREYAALKHKGKPFFPYAVSKDATMAVIVMAVIVLLAVIVGRPLGAPADPATTTYAPRPEWYFFFLFELLRIIRTPMWVPLATIGIPTIAMILLLLLPFYDRGAERRPERRPVAMTAVILTILAMTYLTWRGANTGQINSVTMKPPSGLTAAQVHQFKRGEVVVGQSGCLACHRIGKDGNPGPGPTLTHVASDLPRQAIAQTLRNPTAPMPSFRGLPPKEFKQVVDFIGQLR